MLIDFKTIFDIPTVNTILDFILVVITLVFVNLIINFFVRRKAVTITLSTTSIVFVLSYIFCLEALSSFSLLLVFMTCIVALFVNLAELRTYFANKASSVSMAKKSIKKNSLKKKEKEDVEKIFDHNELYRTINETVLYLSKHKIGAIITFERKDKLENLMKNGTKLDCPVSFELLITIFYPGTRLHDGAVIIKDNRIVAASVYYSPTTKPLLGKYGSRHRAAIGISEICDAVTVVVSEETGRISIAYNGEIESYPADDFYTALENVMSIAKSEPQLKTNKENE